MPTRNTATIKRDRLEARIPGSLKTVLLRAAALQGQTLTDFVVASATAAARRIIWENELLELSERDQAAFAQALLNPPEASAKLKAAAHGYAGEPR